jgi:hypothetical protein
MAGMTARRNDPVATMMAVAELAVLQREIDNWYVA